MSAFTRNFVPKILIVDDSLGDILIMQKALAGLGDIYNAASGMQALEQLRLLKPEIVVLDIEMPDINGLEICQTIRDEPELVDSRVIFATMHEDQHTEYLSFKSGADDFIMKPYSMNICRFRVQKQIKIYDLMCQSKQLMSILDGIPNAISVWTDDERLLCANERFIDAFSLQLKSIQATDMQQLMGQTLTSELWQKAKQQDFVDVSYQSDEEPIRSMNAIVHKKQLDTADTVLVLSINEIEYQTQ
jgi:CheY-like chemotaxis protein